MVVEVVKNCGKMDVLVRATVRHGNTEETTGLAPEEKLIEVL
jgi:hypothetical protein